MSRLANNKTMKNKQQSWLVGDVSKHLSLCVKWSRVESRPADIVCRFSILEETMIWSLALAEDKTFSCTNLTGWLNSISSQSTTVPTVPDHCKRNPVCFTCRLIEQHLFKKQTKKKVFAGEAAAQRPIVTWRWDIIHHGQHWLVGIAPLKYLITDYV